MTRSEEIQLAEAYLARLRDGKLTDLNDLLQAISLKWFRLNTLYKIKTKASAKNAEDDDDELDLDEDEAPKEVMRIKVFKPNEAQRQRYELGFSRDIILKARQLGFTTFEMIDALDDCLFIPDFSAGCIAHRLPSAKDIFRNKIKFAYQNIPEYWKQILKELNIVFPVPVNDKGEGYIFSNGSSIHVDVNYRGDTLQRLHVSEFGKICAKAPDKAEEIVTGAFEAVPLDGQLTIESTAEGRYGYFFEYCRDAQALKDSGKRLTKLDFNFHFFPWWQDKAYSLSKRDTDGVVFNTPLLEYFKQKEIETGHKFTRGQMAWYAKKQLVLKDKMKREYPTTPKEAFEQSIEGAYYTNEIALARKEGRITKVPYERKLPVFTFWDIGRNDTNAIWFMQRVGLTNRFIDYYENNGESMHHYANILIEKAREYGYVYELNYLPHDAEITDYSREDNLSREEVLKSLGFKTVVVPRIDDINEGIEMVRQSFGSCWFDESKCDLGLMHLENYHKEYNPKTETFRDRPHHTKASNGADAFRQFAQGFRANRGVKPSRKRRVSAMSA